MLSPRIKQVLGLLISFALTFVLLYLAFKGVNFSEVIEIISHVSWIWTLILILSLIISHYLRALRWKVILESVKKDTSVLNLFGALMVGYGVNCAIPRLGEISRAVLLGRWENLSRTSMLGTVVVERVIDLISLIIALVISVLIYDGNIYESFPWLKSSLYFVIIIMLALVIFIILIIKFKENFSKIIVTITEKISHKFAQKLAHFFEMLIDGFSSLKGLRNYMLTIFLTTLLMIVYAVNSYVGFYTLYMEDVKTVTFSMGWIIMSISAIGVVIPTPGGTGSYHALAKSVLVLLFSFGAEISTAYAIYTHAVSYILFIILAPIMYYWLNHRYIKRTGNDIGTVNLSESKI